MIAAEQQAERCLLQQKMSGAGRQKRRTARLSLGGFGMETDAPDGILRTTNNITRREKRFRRVAGGRSSERSGRDWDGVQGGLVGFSLIHWSCSPRPSRVTCRRKKRCEFRDSEDGVVGVEAKLSLSEVKRQQSMQRHTTKSSDGADALENLTSFITSSR